MDRLMDLHGNIQETPADFPRKERIFLEKDKAGENKDDDQVQYGTVAVKE